MEVEASVLEQVHEFVDVPPLAAVVAEHSRAARMDVISLSVRE